MVIFTDGSAYPNPGPGGFGVVIYENYNEKKIIDCYAEKEEETTNNRMELKAIIYALKHYGVNINNDGFTAIPIVYSDSSYAINSFLSWRLSWEMNGWKRPGGKEVENLDLIQEYTNLFNQGWRIDLRKIKGHFGIEGNELADALASGKKKVEDILKENE